MPLEDQLVEAWALGSRFSIRVAPDSGASFHAAMALRRAVVSLSSGTSSEPSLWITMPTLEGFCQ